MQPVSATPLLPAGYSYVPQPHPIPVLQQQWAASQLLQNQPLQGDQWIFTAAENKPSQKQTNWQRIWHGDLEKRNKHRDWFECWFNSGAGLKVGLIEEGLYAAIALVGMALLKTPMTWRNFWSAAVDTSLSLSLLVGTYRYFTQDKKA